MENINITIIITSECNLKCKYCINDSGKDLRKTEEKNWTDTNELLDSLKRISEIRNIGFINFYGGEPMLQFDKIKEIVNNKKIFSPDSTVKFAMTINGYKSIRTEDLKFIKDNKMIINISLDGPEKINDIYRISKDGKSTSRKVLENIEQFQRYNIPFAIMAVLDERILNTNLEIIDLCQYFNQYTSIYKIEPCYNIYHKNMDNIDEKYNLILKEKEFIKEMFKRIFELDSSKFIYENNFFRTLNNIIFNYQKEFVCSAYNFMAIYPGNISYSCYNLGEDFKISNNLKEEKLEFLDSRLCKLKEDLKIEKFPETYKNIQYFGDFCPKDGTNDSFAYLYRLTMVEEITKVLNTIKEGSVEHFSILSYLKLGKKDSFFENF